MAIVPDDNTDYRKQFESYKLPELIAEKQRLNAGSPAHDALTNWIEFREAQNRMLALETQVRGLLNQEHHFRLTRWIAWVSLLISIIAVVRSFWGSLVPHVQADADPHTSKAESSQLWRGTSPTHIETPLAPTAPKSPSEPTLKPADNPRPPLESQPAEQLPK